MYYFGIKITAVKATVRYGFIPVGLDPDPDSTHLYVWLYSEVVLDFVSLLSTTIVNQTEMWYGPMLTLNSVW